MKKILTVLLAMAMLLGCVAVFSSCGNKGTKPNLDLEDAAEILEDEDYEVNYTDDEDDLDVGEEEALSAYKIDKNGERSDYIYIYKYANTATAKLAYEEMKMSYDNRIESLKYQIKYYEHILKKYDDDLDSDEIDDIEDDLKECEKDLEKMKEDYTLGRSGKYVWYGTSEAAKDSKG